MRPNFISVELGDDNFFTLIRGRRVTKREVHNNPGNIPVISGHKEVDSYFGWVSEELLRQKDIPIYTKSLITINSNGNVGQVFLRNEERYTFHDDVTGIEIKMQNIDPLYLVYAIRESIAKARFRYDAKLYQRRLKKLKVQIPVNKDGSPDITTQKKLASRYEKLQSLKYQVRDFSSSFENKFIVIDIDFDKSVYIDLSNEDYFNLIKGKRVRKKDINKNPGRIPVISASCERTGYLGFASEDWLRKNGNPILSDNILTVNMDGSVGDVFLRNEERYTFNDVVLGINVVSEDIDPLYLVYAIRESVARERFKYDAKLYKSRLLKLKIRVPIDDEGNIDIDQQKILARKYERLEELRGTIQHFGEELENKFVTIG